MSWLAQLKNYTYCKSIYSVIRAVLRFCKIFIIVPYTETKEGTLIVSKIRLYITYIVPTLNILISFGVLTKNVKFNEVKTNPFYLLGYSRIIIYYLYVLISTLHVNSKHYQTARLCNQIGEWEKKIQLPIKNVQATIIVTVMQIIYASCVISLQSALSIISNPSDRIYVHCRKVIDAFIRILPETNQFLFLDAVVTLGFFVDEIHRRMEKMLTIPRGKLRIVVRNNKPLTRLHENISLAPDNILFLRLFYGEVHDAKELLSNTYSIFNLLTFAYILIELVFMIFLNITLSTFWKPYGENLPMVKFHQMRLIFATIAVRLYFNVYLCHRLARKMKKTGVVVHRLFYEARDPRSKSELSAFSLELLHRSPYLTAAGFFNIDNSLLYGMIGAVTMYTIVLVQFKFQAADGTDPVQSLVNFF